MSDSIASGNRGIRKNRTETEKISVAPELRMTTIIEMVKSFFEPILVVYHFVAASALNLYVRISLKTLFATITRKYIWIYIFIQSSE